jgi:2-methylaconitate cis-trans-isomerase PrpF
VEGKEVEYSLIDVANPCVFVRAADFGLNGSELPTEINNSPDLIELFENVRGAVCEQIGLVESPTKAKKNMPSTPFISFLSEPQNYDCSNGKTVASKDIDITARMFNSQVLHHTYAMTGAMCLGAASKVTGTIPHEFLKTHDSKTVHIGHPMGLITVEVASNTNESETTIEHVSVLRHARPLMRGTAFYRYPDKI